MIFKEPRGKTVLGDGQYPSGYLSNEQENLKAMQKAGCIPSSLWAVLSIILFCYYDSSRIDLRSRVSCPLIYPQSLARTTAQPPPSCA